MPYEKEQRLQQEIATMLEEEANKNKGEVISKDINPDSVSKDTNIVTPDHSPLDEWEEKALKLGWDPNHEGKTFIDAKEYVLRKPLFERIDGQNKQLKELKDRQRQHEVNLAQVRREAYDQAFREIERKKDQAVEDANTAEYNRQKLASQNLINQMNQDKIVNIPQQAPEPLRQEPLVDNEAVKWEKANADWYNGDTRENVKMVLAAQAIDKYLYQQAKFDQGLTLEDTRNPRIDPKNHMQMIEAEVRRMFPHRFPESATHQQVTNQNSNTPVGRSTTQSRDTKNVRDLVAQMTPAQRNLGEIFNKSNPDFTLEKYAADLLESGRLGK